MYLTQKNSNNADPDPVFVLRSGNEDITSLQCYENIIISGSINGKIKFWNTTSKRIFSELDSGCSSSILNITIIDHDDQKTLISHNRSGKIKFWKLKSFTEIELITSWNILAIGFCSISILEKEGCFVAFSKEHSDVGVRSFSLNQSNGKTLILAPEESKGMTMHLKLFFSKRDNVTLLLASYEDGTLGVWNVDKKTLLSSIKLFDDPVMALCLDTQSMKVLAGSAGKELKTIEICDGFGLDLLDTISTQFSGCSAAQIRSDSKLVFVGGWDGKGRVYSWKRMKLLAVLKYHTETINCICFDENKNVIIGCKDGKISLWNIYAK